MKKNDLLQTLSGCKCYQDYVQAREPEPPAVPETKPPPPRPKRSRIDRTFQKYSRLMAGLLLFSAMFLITPLWIAWPPYGKACFLSLPPMLFCTLSWMAGAWWAWDKDQRVLMAVTLGAMPARMLVVLGWAWLVLKIPGPEIPVIAFVLCLMWHWVLFAIPEIAMMMELSHDKPIVTIPLKHPVPKAILEQVKRRHELRVHLHAPGRRV
ncbi:MAG: hypothetical protein HUU20_10515 [Pirellulales bacterium]|nr:hypothetical protein [Pirellulales bacterium]